jgi:hypothetical protein
MWRIAEIMRQSGEALIQRLGISNGLPPIPGNRSSSNGHGSAQIALPTAALSYPAQLDSRQAGTTVVAETGGIMNALRASTGRLIPARGIRELCSLEDIKTRWQRQHWVRRLQTHPLQPSGM